MPAKNKPNELYLTRIYDAPVEAVWDAWTDPNQVAQWWGPRGFTITTHSKDLRPGGSWIYTMHGPDGTDYPNKTYYFEVEKYKKLVYDHGASDDRPPLFRVTVEFSESKGKTTMSMTMALASADAAKEIKKFIKKAGGESTWDRLAEHLDKRSTGREKFVIARSFEAPLEVMFDLWSDPKHLSAWLAPTGFNMKWTRADIRAGGKLEYSVSNGADVTMYGRIEYLEIKRPERLIYTQQFTDQDGHVSRHPHAPTWPETMLTTILFSSEGPSTTRVSLTWEPYGPVTMEEIETFIKGRGGMTQGWTGSFDKLEEFISKSSNISGSD